MGIEIAQNMAQLEFFVFLVVFDGDGDAAVCGVGAIVPGAGTDMGEVFVMMAVEMVCVAGVDGTFDNVSGEVVICFTLGTTFITLRTVIFRFSTLPLITGWA